MQKKSFISLLIIALSFASISCLFNPSQKRNPAGRQETPETTKIDTTFINNSSYDVNVFINAHRRLDGSVRATVKAGQSLTTKIEPSQTDSGDAFYFEYLIPIGNISFPYFSLANSKAYVISADKKNEITIDELTSCPTKSAYLCVENNSTSSIYLVNYNTILSPQEQESHFIEANKCGVYILGENGDPINYKSEKMYFQIGAKPLSLPNINFELGNIYTITVTNDNAVLKTISPFDIDTKRQIWSFDENIFETKTALLRPAYNISDGSLIMGTRSTDKKSVGLRKVNKYNLEDTVTFAAFTHDSSVIVTYSQILDFVQQKDGSIVMLIENTFGTNEDTIQFIICYDFDNKKMKWFYSFDDYIYFYPSSKNKLYCTPDGRIAIAGAVFKAAANSNYEMHRYFAVLEPKDDNVTIGSPGPYKSPDFTLYSKENPVETMFDSIWYDGSNYYVCGYNNWNTKYTDIAHKGIVWRFSDDLSESEQIYECDNALFFCIDGVDNKWAVCGEYCDNGKILKGCYISSDLIDADKDPVIYTVKNLSRTYCYFTQMCCYDNKIVVAGKSSNDFAGTVDAFPIIVAFDKDTSTILWENTTFTRYSDIGGIIPNAINTYTIQLRSENSLHYVSADLLGREK